VIDWHLTEATYGSVSFDTYRPKVIAKCDSCGKQTILTIRVKSRIIDNQLPWECYKCATNKQEVKAQHSQQMTTQWKQEEYKKERQASSKKLWGNKEYRNKISEIAIKQWLEPEKREKLSEYYSEKYKDKQYREDRKQQSIIRWQDPVYRERVIKGTSASLVLTGKQPSSLHTVFSSILDTHNIQYTPEYVVGPYAFDFLVKAEKPILVEINGDYWHSLKSSIERDRKKATYATNNLSQLYDFKVLWEFEFYTKGRVESKIRQWLGIDKIEYKDFEIEQVQIKSLSAKEARIFFTQYHYSGSLGRGGIIYGAYLGEELLAAIVYSPIIRKEVAIKQGLKTTEIIEISRLAIADHRHKKNFASWFINRTRKLLKNKYKMIIAFADTTFGHQGTVYKASGFKLDGKVPPSYWYVDDKGWVMHKKTLWNHATSLRMTEREFATKYKYRKLFGDEKLRYIMPLRIN
jgi:hypothetical protein